MDNMTAFAGWEYVTEDTANGPQPKKLGRGGFGSVFEIKKEGDIDYRSAMKVVSVPRNDNFLREYSSEGMDERQTLQVLEEEKNNAIREIQRQIEVKNNPNIVSIEDYAIGKKKDGLGWDIFIRMELLTPVSELPVTKFIQADVIDLGKDICNALEECHSIGMLHRDIKPENIFVDPNGHYKLGDFGISRVMDRTTGVVSSSRTELYAAPEVIRMEKNRVTSDIYSLGLVLYGLLNRGRPPFLPPASEVVRQNDVENAILRRLSGEQAAPFDGISDELNGIIRKACAFDPKDRFSSAEEMKKRLEEISDFSEQAASFDDVDEKQEKRSNDKLKKEERSNKIAIVGIGGGGCNALDRMIANSMYSNYDVKYIAMNSDRQALLKNTANHKVLIGERLLKGKGASENPELGEKAALEALDDIIDAFKGCRIIIVKCGLGGGTGSGATAIVCKIAKALGAFVFAEATYPFTFEGRRSRDYADLGMKSIPQYADITNVIRNDDALDVLEGEATLQDAFELIDEASASVDFMNYIFEEKSGQIDKVRKDEFLDYYQRTNRIVWRSDKVIVAKDICEIR